MLTLRTLVPCTRAFANQARISRKITVTSNFHISNSHNWAATAALQNRTFTLKAHQPHRNWPATTALQNRPFALKAHPPPEDLSGLQRIYYGSLAPRMKAVKIFSLTTSLAGIAAQPILLEQGMKMGGTVMAVFICGFAGFFTFVTPLLLHFITKKYVTEIHYNPSTGEYTATTISIILQKIQTKFRPEDVTVPDVPGMFTSFFVGKKALFVDPSLFDDPEHYIKIMGYDKPVDFKLDLKETDTPASPKAKQK